MIIDTSVLLAFFDSNEPRHSDVVDLIERASGPLIVSPYVIAELDYIVLSRHGSTAESAVLKELGGGAWELASMGPDRLRTATEIVDRFADIPVGVTDASLAVLADAYATRTIATLDRRHFSVLRNRNGEVFDVVP